MPIRYVLPADLKDSLKDVDEAVRDFIKQCQPEEHANLCIFVDARTNARYCECHLRGSSILALGTIDVPLDPEEQPEYRANREIVEDHVAFERMKTDAAERRTFSNIVTEFTTTFDSDHPLKIIGGQHRYKAIEFAAEKGRDELHGLKVYFDLDSDQRLDVQLISNTNIATSTDLFDRMHETLSGPELRDWCQDCGLLEENSDFADKRARGQAITVRAARTFLVNYFRGLEIDSQKFDKTDTTPILVKTGVPDPEWGKLRQSKPNFWKDKKLRKAGKEFARLVEAQRVSFKGRADSSIDFVEKAFNFAVIAGWSYVTGLLHENEVRLKRHFGLADAKRRDPLNAAALARGRHKTDPENYRGLGYRTDPKERGRFVELFYLQAEKGQGIDKPLIDLAIKKYTAKQAVLEVQRAEVEA